MENKPDNKETISDAALVEKILSGQRNCYSDIVVRFQNRVFSIIYSYTRNYEEARDIAQDVFVAVYNSLPRFDKTRSLTNWVLKIAVYHCYQFLRKAKRPLRNIDLPPDCPDPLDVQVKAETRAKLLKAFNNLPDDLKMVAWLFYFLDRSCKETAEILEISLDLVKIRLFRARKAIGEEVGNLLEEN